MCAGQLLHYLVPPPEKVITAPLCWGKLARLSSVSWPRSALEVSLVECHGTGTALGDPIEVGAQEKIYGKEPRRPRGVIMGRDVDL